MKRMIFLVAMICLIGIFAVATSARAGSIGRYCWNWAPYVDNVEVAITANGAEYEMHGKMVAVGSYHATAVGTANLDAAGGIRFGLSLVFPAPPPQSQLCSLDATIDGNLIGPMTVECTNGFVNTGTLTPIPCPIPLGGEGASGTSGLQ